MCLSQTNWVRENAKKLDTSQFKFWCTSGIKSMNGVDIIVNKYGKNDVLDVKRLKDMS